MSYGHPYLFTMYLQVHMYLYNQNANNLQVLTVKKHLPFGKYLDIFEAKAASC